MKNLEQFSVKVSKNSIDALIRNRASKTAKTANFYFFSNLPQNRKFFSQYEKSEHTNKFLTLSKPRMQNFKTPNSKIKKQHVQILTAK